MFLSLLFPAVSKNCIPPLPQPLLFDNLDPSFFPDWWFRVLRSLPLICPTVQPHLSHPARPPRDEIFSRRTARDRVKTEIEENNRGVIVGDALDHGQIVSVATPGARKAIRGRSRDYRGQGQWPYYWSRKTSQRNVLSATFPMPCRVVSDSWAVAVILQMLTLPAY